MFSPPPARTVTAIGKMFAGKSMEDPINTATLDVAITLGEGKTTEGDELGDSVHTSSPAADDDVPLVGCDLSSDYGSMPCLPSTLPETVSKHRTPTLTMVGRGC